MMGMLKDIAKLASHAVLFVPMAFAATAWAGAEGPAVKIQQIYQAYIAAERGRSREPSMYDRSFYSARINERIARLKQACASRKDLCLPDSDFLVGGQDFRIRDLRLVTSARTARTATVSADFRNFSKHVHLTYVMVLENGHWVIDDLMRKTASGDGGSLEDLLQPLPQ